MTGTPTGLIYESIPVVANAQGIVLHEVFEGLQIMEVAAIAALNEAKS